MLVLTIAVLLSAASMARASSIPTPMRDALDNYGAQYAEFQGWDYVDRLATMHGDYRRAYATLVFATTSEAIINGRTVDVPTTWEVDTRVVRCGPGWYVVSSPLDRGACHPLTRLPPWPSSR